MDGVEFSDHHVSAVSCCSFSGKDIRWKAAFLRSITIACIFFAPSNSFMLVILNLPITWRNCRDTCQLIRSVGVTSIKFYLE